MNTLHLFVKKNIFYKQSCVLYNLKRNPIFKKILSGNKFFRQLTAKLYIKIYNKYPDT